MAKKKVKQVLLVEPPIVEEIETQTDLDVCGHQNMHYTAGVLTCQMSKTHTGLHSAFLNGNPTFWSDAAGTPTRKHA